MHGAGMRVDTQAQKARCYEIMQRALFALPFVVGSHYFMWADEPALGISTTFPEDSNYGLVSESDEPYKELTSTARRVNSQMFTLHSGMTVELSAEARNGSIYVANNGRIAATFTLAMWVNGKRSDRVLTLAPGSRQTAHSAGSSAGIPFVYTRVECDPAGKAVERSKSDNAAEIIGTVVSVAGPTPVHRPDRIAVWNPTAHPILQVPVVVSNRELTEAVNRAHQNDEVLRLRPAGQTGRGAGMVYQLRHQASGAWTMSFVLDDLPPYSSRVFDLVPTRAAHLTTDGIILRGPVQDAIAFQRNGQGYTITNGALSLVKDETSGNAFDHVYLLNPGAGALEGTELGNYSPLVQQIVAGQSIWVHPNAVADVQVREQGPARLVLDMIFAKTAGQANGQVITAIGEKGPAAPLKVEAQPFRCAYRLTFEPDQPWFRAQCLWVENNGPRAWSWGGYFHYPNSRIGGDAKDDEVGGPGVPNYWLSFGAWRDPALKIDYGIVPVTPDDRLNLNFWKDENGGQHPDCQRKVEGELKPGQRWQPKSPEPVVAIFGLRETAADPRPWRALLETLQARSQVRTMVF